jgi:hypothetical protein
MGLLLQLTSLSVACYSCGRELHYKDALGVMNVNVGFPVCNTVRTGFLSIDSLRTKDEMMINLSYKATQETRPKMILKVCKI